MSKQETKEAMQEEKKEILEENTNKTEPKQKVKEQKNEIKYEEEDNKNSEKRNKKNFILTIVILVILMIVCEFFVVSTMTSKSNKIIKGVTISSIDVSNITKAQAVEKLNGNINKEELQNIKLRYEDYETELVPDQIELKYDLEEAVNEAFNIGRNSNLFMNNLNIIKSMFAKNNIEVPVSINEEKLTEFVNNIQANIPGAVEESSYVIEGENLIISKGKRGLKVNYDEFKKMIIDSEKNIAKKEIDEIKIPVLESDPQEIDIEKIHGEIYKEAKDAYYVEEPFQVFPHVLGVDFNISIEEAKQIISENLETYTIPLKITTPKVTTDQLGTKAFPNLLGKYTTYYSSSSSNRKYNIARAAGSINGKTLLPGEIFSYNKTIGNPSQANGYRLATGFANGKHVDSYGGGVCQVSSTLYNAVLYANLDIISRSNHSLPVGYVPASRDATVYYGAVDFKFKNTRKYPIKIVARAIGSALTIEIYGVKEANEYEVEIESWQTSSIPVTIRYIDNPNLPVGTEKVISKGANGYRSVAYKVLKQNGQVISRTLLSSDTYGAEVREIERGTGGYQAPATTEVVPDNTQPSEPIQETPQPSNENPEGENQGGANSGGTSRRKLSRIWKRRSNRYNYRNIKSKNHNNKKQIIICFLLTFI